MLQIRLGENGSGPFVVSDGRPSHFERLEVVGSAAAAGRRTENAFERIFERLPEVTIEVRIYDRIERRIEVADPEEDSYDDVRSRTVIRSAEGRTYVPSTKEKLYYQSSCQ